MTDTNKTTRRNALKTGAATAVAAALGSSVTHAAMPENVPRKRAR